MSVAVITGSAGLIGSESARYFAAMGYDVVGIDNDMRATFFGPAASVTWQKHKLQESLGHRYKHHDLDVRDCEALESLFRRYSAAVELIIHAAAQPSHDWAARDPKGDFEINAVGTLNLLDVARHHSPEAAFIFTSTNKVYGDRPNYLPLIELDTRYEIAPGHPYSEGIPEEMSVDSCLHSLFGASKLAADVLVQEYGRYFGMNTVCFRGGCLTGPNHSGTELHGFLAYLMKCAATGMSYTVFGHKGKQVRDNIHSRDLIRAFDAYRLHPRPGEIYNIGGGRISNCSMLEAIALCQEISGCPLKYQYEGTNRVGDHVWWISDVRKFCSDYSDWQIEYGIDRILREIYEYNHDRWHQEKTHL